MIKEKAKEVYTSPVTETLELKVESVLLDGSPTQNSEGLFNYSTGNGITDDSAGWGGGF